ncbi:MAG: hypothetical protein JW866_05330 [Ignavibacteriales bacterium]|nr:hypothetical protein [Ignavibacteriales bacterium]
MKLKIFTISVICFLLFAKVFAQEGSFIVGANGAYYLPFGGLADRFDGTIGGSFYLGKEVSKDWTWVGKIEYFKYSELNKDNMFKTVTVPELNDQVFKLPLTKLKMSLEVFSLTTEAKYKLFDLSFMQTQVNIGFGFYKWAFSRGDYYDSLYVDSLGTGTMLKVAEITAPALNLKEINGGFSFGLDFDFPITKSIIFSLAANYKMILAELWPTLSLDMEAVSGLQMFELRGGVKLKL